MFPIPRQLDLSDRDYFRAHKNNEVDGLYVGDVVVSRATNQRGQPRVLRAEPQAHRDRTDSFAGVIVMSISPDYFRDFYATLTQPIVAALIRADGVVLARYPDVPLPARFSPGMPSRQRATRTFSPAWSPPYRRSTAKNACSRSASCRAFPST